jgi:hypothetical protein
MSAQRTPDPWRVLIVTATLVAAGCGAFESPVPALDGAAPYAPDTSLPLERWETIACTIAPSDVYPPEPRESFLVTPARGMILYARFVLRNVPPDVPLRWWLDPDGGVLPPGVSLDAQTGELSGVATKSGDFVVILRAESVGVHEGKRYEGRPLRVPIRVTPACLSDDDCGEMLGFGSIDFHCQPDVFSKGGRGGVCTMPQKDTTCPTTTERFQVWLQEAEILKPSKSYEVTGVVTSHVPCRTNVFSLAAGGHDGWCVEVRVDPPESGEPLARPYVEISYRLPRNYPAPIVEGGHYAFHYIRGNEYEGDHTTDGTLLVFGVDVAGEPDPRLVLLGHTGRLLPHDLLERCQAVGTCPVLPDSRLVPSVCAPVASSSCGASRTPAVLVARLPDERTTWVETAGRPLRLASTGGAAEAPAFALHLALSDTFIGDDAGICDDREDDYRLSYYVLPTDACALGRVAAIDSPPPPASSALVVDGLEERSFSPAGETLAFDWEVVLQPAANALFTELTRPGSSSVIVYAYVPGLYDVRGSVHDTLGTAGCGVDDTARFAVEPPTAAYLELSHDLPAALELRVAPVGTPFDVFCGQADDVERVVACPSNLAPAWRVPWDADLVPFTQALATELVPGAGVQWFGPPAPPDADGVRGRYRVGVLYRGKGRVGDAATAYVRVILNRNLGQTLELERDLTPCTFWEVGVLDLDGLQPLFDASTHEPRAVCGEEAPAERPFKPAAAPPAGSENREAESQPTEIAPTGAFDGLPLY